MTILVHLADQSGLVFIRTVLRGLWVHSISASGSSLFHLCVLKVMGSNSQWWPRSKSKTQGQVFQPSPYNCCPASVLAVASNLVWILIWNIFVQVLDKNIDWDKIKYWALRMPPRVNGSEVEGIMPWCCLMIVMTFLGGSMLPLIKLVTVDTD